MCYQTDDDAINALPNAVRAQQWAGHPALFEVTESTPSEMKISEYVKNLRTEIYGESDRPTGLAATGITLTISRW